MARIDDLGCLSPLLTWGVSYDNGGGYPIPLIDQPRFKDSVADIARHLYKFDNTCKVHDALKVILDRMFPRD